MKTGKRVVYIDAIRIIACFFVILNHTSGYINCFNAADNMPFPLFVWRLFVGMIVKAAVPLFFMISGSVLFGKDRTYVEIFKRIAKMFFILLVFSIIANVLTTKSFYLPGFIRTFASARVDGARAYWYLYSYMGLLMMFPFLRYVAEKITLRDTMYLITLRLAFFGVVPALFRILNIRLQSNIYLAEEFQPALVMIDCVFYSLIGYGLDNHLDKDRVGGKKILLLALILVAALLAEEYLTYIAGMDQLFDKFNFLIAVSLFLLIRYAFGKVSSESALGRGVTLLGGLTFGIYLLDPCIGVYLKPAVHSLYPACPSILLVSVLYCLVSMMIGAMLTFGGQNVLKMVIKGER
ncbi:MAG: acyltransferase [Butyrivibrio sp.]|nr:acyltransferase [Butyrivibrio sp.]